jgi:ABC-type Fe3+/spermidine/putrescine transport system ATPase subunit
MTPALHLDDVTASYGATPVLRGLSLDVPAGSLTALLGPSGCGKTTALKVAAGLLAPSAGDVRLGGIRITDLPAERRGMGVVFQKPLLFPHLTVAGNVAFGLEMRGMPAARVREQVAAALRLVHLEHLDQRQPRELSGGQEQRVSLARALVTQPPVLLLDEPFAALDEHLRADMRALVVDVQRRLGVTTLFVSHDQEEATAMASQVALVLDGRVAQRGPPRDFYTAPVSAAVARFFGWCVVPHDAVAAGASVGEAAFHPSAATLTAGELRGGPQFDGVVTGLVDRGYSLRISVRLACGPSLDIVSPGGATCAPGIGAAVRVGVRTAALKVFP